MVNWNKVMYIHTMDYHLAVIKNKLLHTITWMDLIGIVLSEIYTKEFILHNSIYMKFKNKQNLG